jgi:hypothetical protein
MRCLLGPKKLKKWSDPPHTELRVHLPDGTSQFIKEVGELK